MILRLRARAVHVTLFALAIAAFGVTAARADVPAPAASAVAVAPTTSDTATNPVLLPEQPIAQATAEPTPNPRRQAGKKPQGDRFDYSITGTGTAFTGNDAPPHSSAGTTRIGGNFAIHLSDRWLVFYNRGNLDYQLGREFSTAANGKTTTTYPALAEDFIDTIGARYAINSDWYIGAGHYRRWHQCCPASGAIGNENPSVENTAYVDTQFSFGPKSIIGHTFTVYALGEMFGHELSPSYAAAGARTHAFETPNDLPVLKYFDFFIRFPIYHQNKVVPFVRLSETGTYFDSSYYPTQASYVMYGLDLRGSKYWSYQINQRNYTGHIQGQAGLTSHYTWDQISATYRGGFGKL